jgi:hypothetical protein
MKNEKKGGAMMDLKGVITPRLIKNDSGTFFRISCEIETVRSSDVFEEIMDDYSSFERHSKKQVECIDATSISLFLFDLTGSIVKCLFDSQFI